MVLVIDFLRVQCIFQDPRVHFCKVNSHSRLPARSVYQRSPVEKCNLLHSVFVLMARAAATFKQVIKTQKWGSASALYSAIDYSWSAVAIESAIMCVFQQRCSCVVPHLQYSEESGLDAYRINQLITVDDSLSILHYLFLFL